MLAFGRRYNDKRIWERTNHYETPCFSEYRFDILVSNYIEKALLNRKLLNHCRAIPCFPIYSSVLWSVLPKAEDKISNSSRIEELSTEQ